MLKLAGSYARDGRNLELCNLDIVPDGAVVFDENKILFVGETKKIPSEFKDLESIDLSGHCITPEVCDSHTHTVFSGNRADEYAMRLNGASYEEIAKAGGGILSSKNATDETTFDELYRLGRLRIEKAYALGIGSIEIKSGYGLTIENEILISEVIHKLKTDLSPKIQIKNTYLGAHAIPKEYNSSQEYMDKVAIPAFEILGKKGIIDFVDIFHEVGYFNCGDAKKLFQKADDLGIHIKMHADEFNDNGGAILGHEHGAISVDHLLSAGEEGIKTLAGSKTISTVLPGTGFFLGKPQAQARKMLDKGCKLAIASDYNPGSCHFQSLIQIASMIAPHENYKLSLAELWTGITLNGAHAMNLKNQGALVEGMKPRFSIFKCNSISEITYSWGENLAVPADSFKTLT